MARAPKPSEQPITPPGDGGNGPPRPPKGSSFLEISMSVSPSEQVDGGTEVQFACSGDLNTPTGRRGLDFVSGTWSLTFRAPGDTTPVDITGLLSKVTGASTTLVTSIQGTYTAAIAVQFRDPKTGQSWGGGDAKPVTARSSLDFTTDAACAMASSANTVAVVVKGSDQRVWYTWWELGGSARPWIPLGRNVLTDTTPAAALTGSDHHYLFVFAKQAGTSSLHLNQGILGHQFTDWDR
jgi:hypothetical protein